MPIDILRYKLCGHRLHAVLRILLLASTLLCSCAEKQSAPEGELYSLRIRGTAVQVEAARNNRQRALGLMYRESLPADRGMLFIYRDEQVRSFWMKDTKIPLSIAFINAAGRIVDIQDLEPGDQVSRRSEAPAAYALEVNRGWFAAAGITEGDEVKGLDGVPPAQE